MWTLNPVLYMFGVLFLFVSMSFDIIDGWFATRFHPYPTLAELADRIMNKIVYSIIFPLIAVGVMWRLIFITPNYSRGELLHAIFILFLCITVLVRDNFSNFMRQFAIKQSMETEGSELNRLRTVVAAPVSILLYAYAFYIPEGPESKIYFWVSWIGNIPLRLLFIIEIVFLIINFGSIAGYCRKYGSYCLDEISLGDDELRRRILSLFPSALTVMNAMMGLLSVFFAYQGRIREAYLILIGAAFFDKLDGALARRLGLTQSSDSEETSKRISTGGILDDISDSISFCIVPGWIFYLCLSRSSDSFIANLPVALVAWLYILLGIARLTYFTLDRNPVPGFFKGFPTPAAALLVIAPLIAFSQTGIESPGTLRFWGVASFCIMVFASIIMNAYPLRYIHYGRFMNRHPWFSLFNLSLGAVFIFTPYFGQFCLLMMTIYIFSPLFTWKISPDVASRESRLK
jgi:phosphatidylserine synthase